MDRKNIINICNLWLTSHYGFRKGRIGDLSVSDLDRWLKKIEDRWQDDELDKIDKESKVDIILPEQHSEVEESVKELIKLLESSESTDKSIVEKAREILLARNTAESQEEKHINNMLYDSLESLQIAHV